MLVCKQWSLITTEFMYRTITLREPHCLQLLKRAVAGNSDVARWIKHLYVYEEDRLNRTAISCENVDKLLIPVIAACNRLKTLSIEQYVFKATSLRLIDAVERSCKRTLTSLNLRVAHMTECSFNINEDMNGAPSSESCSQSSVGSAVATPPTLVFPSLTSLSMRGSCVDLVGHMMAWTMPILTTLTIDFEICRINNDRGISTILGNVGSQLTVLDIQAADINFDFHEILILCPNLETVSFDLAHWKTSSLSSSPKLTRHSSLKTIGLHGLKKFFGLESWSYGDTLVPDVHTTNFDLLLNRDHLPNLQTIKVLDSRVVMAIAKKLITETLRLASEKWKRWEKECEMHSIRLEDCTGRPLGSRYSL